MMEITAERLLRIIGAKQVEIEVLTERVIELETRIKELTSAPATPLE